MEGPGSWEAFAGMKRLGRAAGIVLLLLAAGAAVVYFFGEKEYNGYVQVRELEVSENASYICVDGRLIGYGQEGVQAVAPDGTLQWNITYHSMKNPVFAFCGDWMAAADIGTKELLLANITGVSKTYSTPFPIQKICVAGQGVCAILMNAAEKDYIYLYDKEGTLLSEIETVVSRDGFPVTIALSEDGTKLVTSYMKIVNDESLGTVTFYNFGGVGQNYSRNLVAQVQYDKCFVPRMEFWGNDTVVILGESMLELFSMKEIPSSVIKKEFSSAIQSVAFGDYLCTITMNAEGKDILEAYDKSGTVRMAKVITFPYTGFQTKGKEVVLYGHSGCEIYTVGKNSCYRGSFEDGISALFAIGGNRYYLIEGKKGSVIKLVH